MADIIQTNQNGSHTEVLKDEPGTSAAGDESEQPARAPVRGITSNDIDLPMNEDLKGSVLGKNSSSKECTSMAEVSNDDVVSEESIDDPDDEESLSGEELINAMRERFATGKGTVRSFEGSVLIFVPIADYYCFQCHKDRVHVACSCCPRSYHFKCLPSGSHIKKRASLDNWECPECVGTIEGDEERKHSPTTSRISEEDFSMLLKFALGTIKQVSVVGFLYHY